MHLAERFSLGVARRTRHCGGAETRAQSRSFWRDNPGPLAGQAVDPSSSPPYLTAMLLARTLPAGFIAPCLPMTAPRPPSGPLWLHEVKHDGFRIIARKDGLRVRLYSRQGNDLTNRFPLIVEAMARLPSCTLDGEGVACDDSGVASFNLLLHRKRDEHAFLFAFDLIELDGEDLRRQSLEQRKFKLHRLLAHAAPGLVFNVGLTAARSMPPPCSSTHGRWASRASCQSARARATSRDDRRTGSR
jgi:ATP-dependent DNA ligase